MERRMVGRRRHSWCRALAADTGEVLADAKLRTCREELAPFLRASPTDPGGHGGHGELAVPARMSGRGWYTSSSWSILLADGYLDLAAGKRCAEERKDRHDDQGPSDADR